MNDRKIINRVIRFPFISVIIAFVSIVFISCVADWSIGKDIQQIEEEIYKDIFVIDSLIMEMKLTLGDSSFVELNK
tara:strand:- start:15015 stop:15242 length:228 start_codon:yes stop_codon:yes gene_type:complete